MIFTCKSSHRHFILMHFKSLHLGTNHVRQIITRLISGEQESITPHLSPGQGSCSWPLADPWLQTALGGNNTFRRPKRSHIDWLPLSFVGSGPILFSLSLLPPSPTLSRPSPALIIWLLSPLAETQTRRHPSLQHTLTAPHTCMDFYIWLNLGAYFTVTDSIFLKWANWSIYTPHWMGWSIAHP